MNDQEANEMIIRLKAKDPQIIAVLFDIYNSVVYGIILRIVKDEGLASQVMQDTFVKAWKKGDTYDPAKGRLFTWLINIARNSAIDATRTAYFKHYKSTEALADADVQHQSNYMPLDFLDIKDHLSNLEEKYRVLIDMAYLLGYTHEEISQELQIPLGTIKTRIRFALGKLREIFTDFEQLA